MRNLVRRLILWACPELVTRPDLAVLLNTVNNNARQTMSQNRWIMAMWRDYVARCPEDAANWERYGAAEKPPNAPTEAGGNPAAYAGANIDHRLPPISHIPYNRVERPSSDYFKGVPGRAESSWTPEAPATRPDASSIRPAPAIPGLEPESDPQFGTRR